MTGSTVQLTGGGVAVIEDGKLPIVDPLLLAEAKAVMALYSTSAQAEITKNLYGPREARLAACVVAIGKYVEDAQGLIEAAELETGEFSLELDHARGLLDRAAQIIETNVAGFADFVTECHEEAKSQAP